MHQTTSLTRTTQSSSLAQVTTPQLQSLPPSLKKTNNQSNDSVTSEAAILREEIMDLLSTARKANEYSSAPAQAKQLERDEKAKKFGLFSSKIRLADGKKAEDAHERLSSPTPTTKKAVIVARRAEKYSPNPPQSACPSNTCSQQDPQQEQQKEIQSQRTPHSPKLSISIPSNIPITPRPLGLGIASSSSAIIYDESSFSSTRPDAPTLPSPSYSSPSVTPTAFSFPPRSSSRQAGSARPMVDGVQPLNTSGPLSGRVADTALLYLHPHSLAASPSPPSQLHLSPSSRFSPAISKDRLFPPVHPGDRSPRFRSNSDDSDVDPWCPPTPTTHGSRNNVRSAVYVGQTASPCTSPSTLNASLAAIGPPPSTPLPSPPTNTLARDRSGDSPLPVGDLRITYPRKYSLNSTSPRPKIAESTSTTTVASGNTDSVGGYASSSSLPSLTMSQDYSSSSEDDLTSSESGMNWNQYGQVCRSPGCRDIGMAAARSRKEDLRKERRHMKVNEEDLEDFDEGYGIGSPNSDPQDRAYRRQHSMDTKSACRSTSF